MSNQLVRLRVKNFRSLAEVNLKTGSLNVLFGPNGAGKSTFLDSLSFLRACAIEGVEAASSNRSHGIGALWDRADEGEQISIEVETPNATYEVRFGYSSGRIEPFVGETLFSKTQRSLLVQRKVGSNKVTLHHTTHPQLTTSPLSQPDFLAPTYLRLEHSDHEIREVEQLLSSLRFYHTRSTDFSTLRKRGSDTHSHVHVWPRYQNLFSVLRNLHDREGLDDRFATILRFMRSAFPTFRNLLLEQTGPESVYCSFIEAGRSNPIKASGVSDGHLQMLAHLTCLFSEGRNVPSLILLDEPEISLHPFALSVLAKAIRVATGEWNKQVFVATHSPVLISQFEPEEIIAATIGEDGRTILERVSEMKGIEDLLDQYAMGSLYMAEMIAPQSTLSHEPTNGSGEEDWKARGFRWPTETVLPLPDQRNVTIRPHRYLSVAETADMSELQKKNLRIYTLDYSDGEHIDAIREPDVERRLSAN